MLPAAWLQTLTLALLAMPLFAGESAILTSGMRLHVDRHEVSAGVVRLFRGTAVTELSTSAVFGFEPDEEAGAVTNNIEEKPAIPAPPPADSTSPAAAPATSPTTAPQRLTTDPRGMVRDAAARAGLPAAFVESVAKTESGFDPKAVSSKGAIGVMQLMPATAKSLGVDPADPAQNIDAGARLLRQLLIKYGGDVVKALAAYNAGEAAVDHYQGVPPYQETQHYVNTVVRDYLKGTGQ